MAGKKIYLIAAAVAASSLQLLFFRYFGTHKACRLPGERGKHQKKA